MQSQPGPKHPIEEPIPPDLRRFFARLSKAIDAGVEETRIPSDDLLQGDRICGGLDEEGGNTFSFTFFAGAPAHPTRVQPTWSFSLDRSQLQAAGLGARPTLSFWACADPVCRNRFRRPDARCPDCDFPARDPDRLPAGPFSSKEEWALAYFRKHPDALSLEMIGEYNGHTDLGQTLGYFSLPEADRLRAEALGETDPS